MIDVPICLNCKHFDFDNDRANTCAAFPGGIPAAILESHADHRKAFAGDAGRRYEPINDNWTLPERLSIIENGE